MTTRRETLTVVKYPLGRRVTATLLMGAMAACMAAFLAPALEVDFFAQVVMFLFAVFFLNATFRAATGPDVRFYENQVCFRKMVRSQTFQRSEVVQFEPGPWSFNGVQKVAVRMIDGSVRTVPLDGPMGRGKRFQRILDEGNAWLEDCC